MSSKQKRTRPTTLAEVNASVTKTKTQKETPKSKKPKPSIIRAYLPDGMRDDILAISQHYDCTISDVTAYLLALSLEDYFEGRLDIESLLIPTRTMNARNKIDFEYTPPPQE